MLAGEQKIAREAKVTAFLLSVLPCGPAREQPFLLQLPELCISSKGKYAIVTEWDMKEVHRSLGKPGGRRHSMGYFKRWGRPALGFLWFPPPLSHSMLT